MSRQSIYLTLLSILVIVLWSPHTTAIAAETGDYSADARELSQTDKFHIRLALRKAVFADSPGDEFYWRNSHTGHRGSITLLEFIKLRSDGSACVDLVHTYYPETASPKKSNHTACSSQTGSWADSETEIAATVPKSAVSYSRKNPRSSIQKYTDNAKELNKTDAFNIRVALRRAINAESPGDEFHWRNSHTRNRGTISLSSFIEPRSDGRECVDFVHIYYSHQSRPDKTAHSVCRDQLGRWQLGQEQVATSAPVKKNAQVGRVTTAPRYDAETVYEVQGLLAKLSYAPGPIDGLYGNKTRRAIKLFQRDEKLPVTGEISDSLLRSLQKSIDTLENLSIASTTTKMKPSQVLPSAAQRVDPNPVDSTPSHEETELTVQPRESETVLPQSAGGTLNPIIVKSRSTDQDVTLASAGPKLVDPPPPTYAPRLKTAVAGTPKTRYSTQGTLTDFINTTSASPAEQDPIPDRKLAESAQPYLLTIDGIDFTLIPEAEAIPVDKPSVPSSYLMTALKPEWDFAHDWHHVPWSGTYADISKNVTRVKSNIYRIYQTASRENRYLVVATHSWGGVLAYRAIFELYEERKIPVGAIDVLITMGSPLNAQYADMKNVAANYGRWSGSQVLTEPVKAWLNYWIEEDDFSGSISGITNTELPYTYEMEVFPHNAYHQTEQFRKAIEWDVKTSLQNLDMNLAEVQLEPDTAGPSSNPDFKGSASLKAARSSQTQ